MLGFLGKKTDSLRIGDDDKSDARRRSLHGTLGARPHSGADGRTHTGRRTRVADCVKHIKKYGCESIFIPRASIPNF